jgi:aspartate aminotransferase, cytoplasmic
MRRAAAVARHVLASSSDDVAQPEASHPDYSSDDDCEFDNAAAQSQLQAQRAGRIAAASPASGTKQPNSLLAGVPLAPPDPIFGLNSAFKADKSGKKVNLGVGAYRTAEGKPWVLQCVQRAEAKILASQASGNVNKEYLPIDGHAGLRTRSAELIFGKEMLAALGGRCQNIQCVSGTGALRLGFEFAARFMGQSGPAASGKKPAVLVPDPTWANHQKIITHAGLTPQTMRYLDRKANTLDLQGLLADLRAAPQGSVVLLHACAHNPTGVDPTLGQWDQIAEAMQEAGHFAFFDSAYQGFASGDLARDAGAVRLFVERGIPLFVAQSYSKNFGLYGERTGCLQVVTASEEEAKAAQSQLKGIARGMYSNPPIHGALIVATILGDAALTKLWHEELNQMAARIGEMRKLLFDALQARGVPGNWTHITSQIGMFSYTGLTKEQVQFIIKEHHIYLTADGRISMAGLNSTTVDWLAAAIHDAVNKS